MTTVFILKNHTKLAVFLVFPTDNPKYCLISLSNIDEACKTCHRKIRIHQGIYNVSDIRENWGRE